MLGCDLFVQRPGRTYAELWRGSTYPLEAADIAALADGGIDHLYVRAEAAKAYGDYLRQHVLHNKDVSPKARMQALREVTRVLDVSDLMDVAPRSRRAPPVRAAV